MLIICSSTLEGTIDRHAASTFGTGEPKAEPAEVAVPLAAEEGELLDVFRALDAAARRRVLRWAYGELEDADAAARKRREAFRLA